MSRWYQVPVPRVTPDELYVLSIAPSYDTRRLCLSLDQRKTYERLVPEVANVLGADWFCEAMLLVAHASRVNCVPRSSPVWAASVRVRYSALALSKSAASPILPESLETVNPAGSVTSLLLLVESRRVVSAASLRCQTPT